MRHPARFRVLTRAATLVLAAVLIAGCSSASKTDDPWTIQYVGSSDDTWTAMHIAFIDLDYEVESEDRNEGRIRAVRAAEGERPGSVLTISQVARHDMVSIWVRVSAPEGEPPMDRAQQEVFAEEFLKPVNGLLFK